MFAIDRSSGENRYHPGCTYHLFLHAKERLGYTPANSRNSRDLSAPIFKDGTVDLDIVVNKEHG